MIKANELRIGNRVYGGDPARSIAEILTIVQEGVEAKYWLIGANSSSDNPSNALAESNNSGIGFAKFEDIYPIPLTPDILESEGWYELGMGHFRPFGPGKPRNQLNCNVDNIVRIMDPSGYVIMLADNIRNVHQLQNLYFALTGQELEVKF